MAPPQQKPGRSRQDYGTPDDLLAAIARRLRILGFATDLAADADNAIAPFYWTKEADALIQDWPTSGWNWCNPPYADIAPWVQKAMQEATKGVQTVMLLPASVGSNWYAEFVEDFAFVNWLNPRVTFKGETAPYPKDCMLCFYTPWGFTGNATWYWRQS